MIRLVLGTALRTQIENEARAAFPRECCGLIEGVRSGDVILATRLHAARNIATEPDRFEIDPAEHIKLLRATRDAGRAVIGCYHSHPNGDAELSACDRAGAGEKGFVWLVIGLTERVMGDMKVYVDDGASFSPGKLVDQAQS